MSIPSPHFGSAYRLIMPRAGIYDEELKTQIGSYHRDRLIDAFVKQHSKNISTEADTVIRHFDDNTATTNEHVATAIFTNTECRAINPLFANNRWPGGNEFEKLRPHLDSIEPKNTYIIQTLNHLKDFLTHNLLPDLKPKA